MTTKAARVLLWAVVLGMAAHRHEARGQDAASVEYKIKAAYMLNFAKFVEWPSAAFPTTETPVTLCVLGKDPFGSDLEKTISDKSIERRQLQIKRVEENKPLPHCHILFISSSERKRLPQILEALKGRSVLTVSEMDQFSQLGGMIHFFKQDNTIRFEINAAAVQSAHLKISSKLLQVGKPVRDDYQRVQK